MNSMRRKKNGLKENKYFMAQNEILIKWKKTIRKGCGKSGRKRERRKKRQ